MEGEIRINESEEAVPLDHFVLFENEGDTFHIEATENSKVLILSGEPIREPIASHGPFVMNRPVRLMASVSDPPPLLRRSITTPSTPLALKSFKKRLTSLVVL